MTRTGVVRWAEERADWSAMSPHRRAASSTPAVCAGSACRSGLRPATVLLLQRHGGPTHPGATSRPRLARRFLPSRRTFPSRLQRHAAAQPARCPAWRRPRDLLHELRVRPTGGDRPLRRRRACMLHGPDGDLDGATLIGLNAALLPFDGRACTRRWRAAGRPEPGAVAGAWRPGTTSVRRLIDATGSRRLDARPSRCTLACCASRITWPACWR